MITRRRLVKRAMGLSLAASLPGLSLATVTLPATPGPTPRFILLILRGGLDGLAALPPQGDPDYRAVRGGLALPETGTRQGILDLDGFYGLHPALRQFHALYQAGELLPIHACAPPYSRRSHFDAQNILETGIAPAHSVRDGWLYRALSGIGAAEPAQVAMAVGPSIPAVLRGQHPVGSWAPDSTPPPDEDTLARLVSLYQQDDVLGPNLAAALAAESMVSDMQVSEKRRGDALTALAEATAQFLRHDQGPQVAVLEAGGWDTHFNQGAETGTLAARLGQLDKVSSVLKSGLGSTWKNTTILVVTEFGRTAAMNGTRGSDHGVGGAAFLMGGAVAGGRVVADWHGLSKDKLFQGRDLMPTIDQRQVFRAVLVDHLGIDGNLVDELVFPESRDLEPLPGLFAGRKPVVAQHLAKGTSDAVTSPVFLR